MNMCAKIFFLLIGLTLIYQGHPGWGLFSCILAFDRCVINYTKEEGEKDE